MPIGRGSSTKDILVYSCPGLTLDRIVAIVYSHPGQNMGVNMWQDVRTTVKERRGDAFAVV